MDIIDRFWNKIAHGTTDKCWPWTASTVGGGYGVFALRPGKIVYAHRFSYFLTFGPFPEEMKVLHECDNPICVNPWHLKLGTHKNNMEDRAKRGRGNQRKGEAHYRATITEDDVRDIRQSSESQKELGARYHLSQTTISGILLRKIWKSVE